MGLASDAAFSREKLRQRRNRLMIDYHPDHGGSNHIASEINVTYARMVAWLDKRDARDRARQRLSAQLPATSTSGKVAQHTETEPTRSALSETLRAGASQLWAVALVVVATYAALRRDKNE